MSPVSGTGHASRFQGAQGDRVVVRVGDTYSKPLACKNISSSANDEVPTDV